MAAMAHRDPCFESMTPPKSPPPPRPKLAPIAGADFPSFATTTIRPSSTSSHISFGFKRAMAGAAA